MTIQVKRAYDPPAPDDGCRVLVDRLWPRGLSKERAAVDEWLREVAPSTVLRRWFAHDPVRWAEFKRRYSAELEAPAAREAVARLRSLAAEGPITLLLPPPMSCTITPWPCESILLRRTSPAPGPTVVGMELANAVAAGRLGRRRSGKA